jgi:hypothetical protein
LAGSLAATGSYPSSSLVIFALPRFLVCLVAGADILGADTGSVGVVAAVGVVESHILGGSNMGKD